MNLQELTTILAWTMVVLAGLIALYVVHNRSCIDWYASATFALAALLLAVAAATSATSVLMGGPRIPDEARWAIIVCRALSTVLFLATAMDVTGRPRWLARILRRHE